MKEIPDWYDVHHGVYARNVGRIMVGRRFVQESDETEGYDFVVDRVSGVVVGIDSVGIFAGITVRDLAEREFTFYSNGTVADADDLTVGRHTLALGPDPEPVENRRKPAGPLFALAAGLAREEWTA